MAKRQRSKSTVSDAQIVKVGLVGLLLLVIFYIFFNILLVILAPGVFLTTQLFARNNIDPSLWAWWGLALALSSVFLGAIYFATKMHPKLTIPGYTLVCITFIVISAETSLGNNISTKSVAIKAFWPMRNASLQEIMFPRQGVGDESKISSNLASNKDFTYANTSNNEISTKTITNSDQETALSAQPAGALSQPNTQEKLAIGLTESLRVQAVNAKNSGAILLTWILQHPTRLPEINQIKLQLENLPNKPINGDRIAAKKFNEQGLRLMKLDQIDDAISSFRNGTEADPSDPEIKDNFVTALIAGKQFSAAEEIAGDILTHRPRMASAWFNLSEIYINQGKPSEATNALIASYQLSDQKNEVKEAIRANTLDVNSPIHDAAKKSMKVIELL